MPSTICWRWRRRSPAGPVSIPPLATTARMFDSWHPDGRRHLCSKDELAKNRSSCPSSYRFVLWFDATKLRRKKKVSSLLPVTFGRIKMWKPKRNYAKYLSRCIIVRTCTSLYIEREGLSGLRRWDGCAFPGWLGRLLWQSNTAVID